MDFTNVYLPDQAGQLLLITPVPEIIEIAKVLYMALIILKASPTR